MNDKERRFVPLDNIEFESRSDDNGTSIGTIRGHAAVFNSNSVDLGGFTESIKRGAFKDAIAEDDVRALVNHDPNLLLARTSAGTLTLREDRTGLRMEIDVPNTTAGRDVKTSIERGDMTGASFGFRVVNDEWNTEDEVPHRTLTSVRLYDVGPVTYPAYPDTQVATRSLDAWKAAHEQNETEVGEEQSTTRRRELDRLTQRHAEAKGQ